MLVVVDNLALSFSSSGASSLFFSRWLQHYSHMADCEYIDIHEKGEAWRIAENEHAILEQMHTAGYVLRSFPEVPYTYGIHDWIFKLQRLRNPWWDIKWIRTMFREVRIFRKAYSVIHFQHPSFWEKLINPNIQVVPFRILSDQTETSWKNQVNSQKTAIKFVHFGSMNATCNRLGFKHLINDIWPKVLRRFPDTELHVIGNTERLDEDTKRKAQLAGVIFHGFVKDWTTLMPKTYRIVHLVPWRHNTGIRTRVPETLLAGHEILAYKACMGAYQNIFDLLHLVHRRNDFIKSICSLMESGPNDSVLKTPDAYFRLRTELTLG